MRLRLVWLLIGLALVVVGVGAALAQLPVPTAISSTVAALGAIIASVSTARAAVVLKARDDHRENRQALLRCDRRGRLPLVSELNDPVQLGVHPAAVVGSFDGPPAFVRRDIMAQLTAAMSRHRFVLLVGESTAGKSRAAYEAVRALFPNHQLVDPCGRDAVQAAVNAIVDTTNAVLWLDDIERFLGDCGFTGANISSVLSSNRHSIVATMRSEEYSYFCGGPSATPDAPRSRETIRQGWDVLRLATRIDLPRSWSANEILATRQFEPSDPRVAAAIEHVDQFGVAEYLAAGPQLLASWLDAWAPCTHARAAALVIAAVDARRSGIHRPLSRETLVRAHESYLSKRGGHRLRPESIDSAIQWATTPLHATSSLLIPDDDGNLTAFDYLIDAIERVAIPAGAFEAFVSAGRPEEFMDIGQAAWNWGKLDQAESAFEAASATHVDGYSYRGYVIQERNGDEDQRKFLKNTIAELAEKFGWNHEKTIEVRTSLAWDAEYGNNVRLGLRDLIRLKNDTQHIIGRFHPATLNIRRGIAYWLGETGETREAIRILAELTHDCLDHLDESDPFTYTVMIGYARHIATASTKERGLDLLNELEAWMRTRRAPAQMFKLLEYTRARLLCESGRFQEGLKEFESLVANEEKMSGHMNSRTLSAHRETLEYLSKSGERARALQRAKLLLSECEANVDSNPIDMHYLRLSIADITGESGDTVEAARILVELRSKTYQQFGEHDLLVDGIDLRLRFWAAIALAHNGHVADATEKLRCLSEDIAISRGVSHYLRETVLRALDAIASGRHEDPLDHQHPL